jgi:hypothetical protein
LKRLRSCRLTNLSINVILELEPEAIGQDPWRDPAQTAFVLIIVMPSPW